MSSSVFEFVVVVVVVVVDCWDGKVVVVMIVVITEAEAVVAKTDSVAVAKGDVNDDVAVLEVLGISG